MAYPNLKQSVWLVVLVLLIDIALGLALRFPGCHVRPNQTTRLI